MDLTIRDSSNVTPQDPGVARVRNPFHSIHRTTRRDRDASMKPRRTDETIFERRRTLNLARERGLARDGDGAEGDRNHFLPNVCRVVKRGRPPVARASALKETFIQSCNLFKYRY